MWLVITDEWKRVPETLTLQPMLATLCVCDKDPWLDLLGLSGQYQACRGCGQLARGP